MEGSILIALRSRVNSVLSCAKLTKILGGPEKKGKSISGAYTVLYIRKTSATYLGTMSLNSSIFSLPADVSNVDVHKNDRSLCRSHRGVTGEEEPEFTTFTFNQPPHSEWVQYQGCPISCPTFLLAGTSIIDEAIKSEEDRVVVFRFGHDWDSQCMVMDETLYSVAEKVQNFAVIYLCDITEGV